MEVKIDINEQDRDGRSMRDRIIDETVSEIREEVESGIVTQARADAQKALKEQIAKMLADIVKEVVATPVQPTNTYGEPKGEPITLRELILKEVNTYLQQGVDGRGRSDRCSSDKIPRIRWFITTAVRKAIDEEYAKVIKDAGEEMRRNMDGRIADLFRKSVYKLAGIPELPAKGK
jgi:hypothetical protein